VRAAKARAGSGIGEALLRHAIEIARSEGCGLVQLTTDRRRDAAHRFYERLGFIASHLGMKLEIAPDQPQKSKSA
jgi:GNAT superfamily N-acetyltransferase